MVLVKLKKNSSGLSCALFMWVGMLAVSPQLMAVMEDRSLQADWIEVERNEKWCGAKALWIISRSHGKTISFLEIKKLCDPGESSTGTLSIAALESAASRIGLAADAVRCRLSWLANADCLAITLHRPSDTSEVNDSGQDEGHFIVLVGRSDEGLRCIDPFNATMVVTVPEDTFASTWTGEALLVARTQSELPTIPRWVLGLFVMDGILCIGLMVQHHRLKGSSRFKSFWEWMVSDEP